MDERKLSESAHTSVHTSSASHGEVLKNWAGKRMVKFKLLAREYDPTGKFRNEFLERNIIG